MSKRCTVSLLDDLRAAANAIDPQFQVTSQEAGKVVTAVAAYLEHGQDFLNAAEAGVADVTALLAPPPPAPAPAVQAAEAPAASLSDTELDALISDLQAQKASRVATSQQTQVTHETGADS